MLVLVAIVYHVMRRIATIASCAQLGHALQCVRSNIDHIPYVRMVIFQWNNLTAFPEISIQLPYICLLDVSHNYITQLRKKLILERTITLDIEPQLQSSPCIGIYGVHKVRKAKHFEFKEESNYTDRSIYFYRYVSAGTT